MLLKVFSTFISSTLIYSVLKKLIPAIMSEPKRVG